MRKEYSKNPFLKARKRNMKISKSKTKSMTIAKDPIRCKLVIDFDDLDCMIFSRGNLKEEVKRIVNKAASISGHLKSIGQNKQISIQTKSRINKTCVKQVMSYGAKTKTNTSKTKKNAQKNRDANNTRNNR